MIEVHRTLNEGRFLTNLDDPQVKLLVDLQDLVTRQTAKFWSERAARNLHLPITTMSVSSPMGLGSDSLPVEIDLFGQPTYLADSMQFMLEYGCRLCPDGAWYLMPSFRGEAADETHLNQFFHSEVEVVTDLDGIMNCAEEYVRFLTRSALEECGESLLALLGDVKHLEAMVVADRFVRLTLDEAAVHLEDDAAAIRIHPEGFRVLTRHGERRLMDEISPWLWVSHFDHLSVPFYQAYADGERQQALNADLLFGLGEIVGAGERHSDGIQARAALAHHGVDSGPYEWYIRMKEEYPLKTSGFGLGIERWMMWVLQHDDIRDLQILPRYNGLCTIP